MPLFSIYNVLYIHVHTMGHMYTLINDCNPIKTSGTLIVVEDVYTYYVHYEKLESTQ